MYYPVLIVWLILMVGRFLATTLRVLPQAVTYVDFLLFPITLGAFLMNITSRDRTGMRPYIILFLMITAISLVVNLQNTRIGLGVLYLVGMTGGPLIAELLSQLKNNLPERSEHFMRVLKYLFYGNLVVFLVLNIPQFLSSGNPDVVTGTFGHQGAYYFVIFSTLAIGLFTSFFILRKISGSIYMGIAVLWLAIFLLAQFRAAFIGWGICGILTIYFIMSEGNLDAKSRTLIKRVGVVFAGGILIYFVSGTTKTAEIYEQQKFDDIFFLLTHPDVLASSPKVQQGENVIQLYSDIPITFFIGAGPGALISRAFQMAKEAEEISNRSIGQPRAAQDIIWKYVLGQKSLNRSLQWKYAPFYDTKYEAWLMNRGGSAVMESPNASLFSIPMETGFLSMVVILLIYTVAIRRMLSIRRIALIQQDHLGAGFATAAIYGLIMILSIIWVDNYLEVQFVTIQVWMMVGMAHLRARVIRETVPLKRDSIDVKETPGSPGRMIHPVTVKE